MVEPRRPPPLDLGWSKSRGVLENNIRESKIVYELMNEQGLKVIVYCTDCKKIISSSPEISPATVHAAEEAGRIHAQANNHWVIYSDKGHNHIVHA